MQLLGGESFSDSSTSHFAAPKEVTFSSHSFRLRLKFHICVNMRKSGSYRNFHVGIAFVLTRKVLL